MVDQLAQFLIADLALTYFFVEIYMAQDAIECTVVGFDPTKGLVKLVADVFVRFIDKKREARLRRHPECPAAAIPDLVLGIHGSLLRLDAVAHALVDDALAGLLKTIGTTFQEEHPKDVFLEFRGIHLSTKNVRRGKKVPLQLRKRQRHFGSSTVPAHNLRYLPDEGNEDLLTALSWRATSLPIWFESIAAFTFDGEQTLAAKWPLGREGGK